MKICVAFKNTNLGLEAKDSNNKTHRGSNTQADDDRFSIVVARERRIFKLEIGLTSCYM